MIWNDAYMRLLEAKGSEKGQHSVETSKRGLFGDILVFYWSLKQNDLQKKHFQSKFNFVNP